MSESKAKNAAKEAVQGKSIGRNVPAEMLKTADSMVIGNGYWTGRTVGDFVYGVLKAVDWGTSKKWKTTKCDFSIDTDDGMVIWSAAAWLAESFDKAHGITHADGVKTQADYKKVVGKKILIKYRGEAENSGKRGKPAKLYAIVLA